MLQGQSFKVILQLRCYACRKKKERKEYLFTYLFVILFNSIPKFAHLCTGTQVLLQHTEAVCSLVLILAMPPVNSSKRVH